MPVGNPTRGRTPPRRAHHVISKNPGAALGGSRRVPPGSESEGTDITLHPRVHTAGTRRAWCFEALPRYSWPKLMRRAPIEMERAVDCLKCWTGGSRRGWLAAITSGVTIVRILEHLELKSVAAAAVPPRAPPQLELSWEGARSRGRRRRQTQPLGKVCLEEAKWARDRSKRVDVSPRAGAEERAAGLPRSDRGVGGGDACARRPQEASSSSCAAPQGSGSRPRPSPALPHASCTPPAAVRGKRGAGARGSSETCSMASSEPTIVS